MFGSFRRTPPRPPRALLRLEPLEERATPATVTNLNDGGPGSLRDAIANTPDGGLVDFAPGLTGTITLSQGSLFIDKSLTIAGPGAGVLAVSGGNQTPVAYLGDDTNAIQNITITGLTLTQGNSSFIGGGIFNSDNTLTLDGVTISNSVAGFQGGGLFNDEGVVTIRNSTFTQNQADEGAAIHSRVGSLTVENTTISGNTSADGGAIGFGYTGYSTLPGASAADYVEGLFRNCTISGNTSGNGGGGFDLRDGDHRLTVENSRITGNAGGGGGGFRTRDGNIVTIRDSSILDNQANFGGGFYSSGGLLDIRNSTISGNESKNAGGGLYLSGNVQAAIENTTIRGNRANDDGGGLNVGGNGVVLNIRNGTIVDNLANADGPGGGDGGGLSNNGGGVSIVSTILANNGVGQGGTGPDLVGDAKADFSLIENVTGGNVIGGNNVVGLDPMLGNFQNNGGPTQTHALLPGSPAIDKGDFNFAPTPPVFDQRGGRFNRIIGGRVDIGSFEFQPPATGVALMNVPNPSQVGQLVTFTANVAGLAQGSNLPEGTVTFNIDGVAMGTVTLAGGIASFSTAALSPGSHTVFARYNGEVIGDFRFDPANSPQAIQTVNRFATGTTVISSAPTSDPGQPVTFTATVTPPGGGQPTGTVSFFDGDTLLGTVALTGSTATLTTAALVSGTHTITATYNGDGTFATSTATLTQTVTGVIALLQPRFAAGAGAGGSPHVKVFGPGGSLKFEFFAYESGFSGGVRVATGDVDGDGIDDIITGAGPGGSPHVRAFSGFDLRLLANFFAYDSKFKGGVYVGAADVTGDGRADIITGAGRGGQPHVKVFDGATGALVQNFFAYDDTFKGGVTVAGGDVNGDGRADIVTGAGAGGGPHVKVFNGTNLALLQNFFAFEGANQRGVFVGAGDLDGDGRADLVVGAGAGGPPQVKVYRGNDLTVLQDFLAFPSNFASGVTVSTARVDLINRDYLLVGAGPGGGTEVKAIDALNLQLRLDFNAFDPDSFSGGVFVG